MADDRKDEPTEKTTQGYEVPTPKRDEFFENMRKVANVPATGVVGMQSREVSREVYERVAELQDQIRDSDSPEEQERLFAEIKAIVDGED